MTRRLEQLCEERGVRISPQRRDILHVISEAEDHPSAEEVHRRAVRLDPKISLATVYRTLNTLVEIGILSRVEFGDGRAHYEKAGETRHEHLIDVMTGHIHEFRDDAIEALLNAAAAKLGYRLLQYRLELFGASESPEDPLLSYDSGRCLIGGYIPSNDRASSFRAKRDGITATGWNRNVSFPAPE